MSPCCHKSPGLINLNSSIIIITSSAFVDEENQAINRTFIGTRIEKIKQDIVDTLRKAVDVVSRHAGSALPEPASESSKALHPLPSSTMGRSKFPFTDML